MKPIFKGLFCAGGLLAASVLAGATTLEEIEAVQADRAEAGWQSQNRIGDIVTETDSMEAQYKRVLKELEGLKVFNTLMQRQIDQQEKDIDTINGSIDEVEATARQMMPLMMRMIEALDMFVEADAPFLLDERRKRVGGLYELMGREDVSVAERFRKVLEAYQIENDYGRTIEAYKESVDYEGATLEVDVLRVGRVALVYQTGDQSTTRMWDRDAETWVDLEGSYRNQVSMGLKVARKQVAPDLLLLPIAAPEAEEMYAKRIVSCALLGMALTVPVQSQDAISLDELLDLVKQGSVRENQEIRAREEQFRQARGEQQRLLDQALAEQAAEERRSQRMENTYGENQRRIASLTETLEERLGALTELFGVTQQVAGDARSKFESSLTNVQYPDRAEFLTNLVEKLGTGYELPSIEEMERLWWELQREMTESAKVVRFNTDVISLGGERASTEVVRVGLFNIVTDGKYLNYRPETGNVTELGRQPEQGRYTNSTEDIIGAGQGEVVRFGLDPTLGGVLNSLVGRPNLIERIQQGALVGYLILVLGIIGLLISLERLVTLTLASRKVTAQLRSQTPSNDNALGRVLAVYHDNKDVDTETLELKLGEAIFKETPKLNRALLFIQIISVVAPLMGLLGTVTGMIKTFQAITLYGTGDPKLMAGGISQALVTTVLGLSVAIPMVLLHTVVSGRSRRIVQILQEQSTGIVAEHSEAQHKAPAA